MASAIILCDAGPLAILAIGQTHRFEGHRGWAQGSPTLKLQREEKHLWEPTAPTRGPTIVHAHPQSLTLQIYTSTCMPTRHTPSATCTNSDTHTKIETQ